MRKNIFSLLFCAVWSLAAVAAPQAGWEPSVKASLGGLIAENRGNADAYAVFDFDYTLVLGDSSYVCLWQILETGDFRDANMVARLMVDLPEACRPEVEACVHGVDAETRVKAFWPLYRRFWRARGDAFGCAWRSRLFAGYERDDLRGLARAAMRENARRTGHRPDAHVPSEKRGFVVLPEVVRLLADLRAAGIAVYVVSGSRTELLLEGTGPAFGLNIPPNCVFGCDSGVEAGRKPQFIRAQIAPRHHGRDPVLVAGDSMGDYAMFTEMPGVRRALIFHRANAGAGSAPLRRLIESAPGPDGKFLVQGRDEPNGRMIPSHCSVFD